MRTFITGIAVGALLLLTAASSEAAIVYLKDGGQVRGTVVSATAQDLQLHTPDGMLVIATDRILRVDYSESPAPAASASEVGAPPPAAPEARRVRRARRYEPVDDDTAQMFSLGFGFSAPLSRVDFSSTGGGHGDNGDTGLYLGAQYIHDITSRLGAGFNIEYLGRSPTGSQSLVPESNTDVSGNSLLLLGTVKLAFTDRGPVRPYVLAGLGANHTSTIVDATPNQGFAWSDTSTGETRTLVDDSHWGLATTARLGLDFMFDPTIFTLEFGWNGLSNADAQATSAGRVLGLDHVNGDLSALTFAARWGWRF